ncbi:MAG: ABC transporter permease [Clostridiales bacterium]|jgi:spermidine/putrescine transport system permease protein|nr:ABC transporter permease [Clostridiales bacterium]
MGKRIYIFMIMALLYLPVAIVIIYSFNASKSGAVWTGFTLDWYSAAARDGRLIDSLLMSLEIAFFTCIISCVLGTMGAVGAARMRPRAKQAASLFMYISLIIPEIILGVALLMFFSVLNVRYGVMTMVLSHTTFCVPYVFIMVSIRLRAVDPSFIEAARDLGAKPFKAFASITLPIIMPAIASGALISMAMSLDDVVISSLVSGPQSVTLPMRIYSMLRLGVTPEINALSTVLVFVMFMLVGLLQFVQAGRRSERAAKKEARNA